MLFLRKAAEDMEVRLFVVPDEVSHLGLKAYPEFIITFFL
jgi:hypothetical protein